MDGSTGSETPRAFPSFLTLSNVGLVIAVTGVGLLIIDKATTKNPADGGSVYGRNGFLVGLRKLPLDPTVLFIGFGLALWACGKFGVK